MSTIESLNKELSGLKSRYNQLDEAERNDTVGRNIAKQIEDVKLSIALTEEMIADTFRGNDLHSGKKM